MRGLTGVRPQRDNAGMEILSNSRIHETLAPEWRLVNRTVRARFLSGDFPTGVRFVDAVAEAAEDADHHPDIDLRYLHVDLELTSHSAGGVTRRDISVAARISEIAAGLGIGAAPERLTEIEIALDTPRAESIAPFWAAVLGGDIGEVNGSSGFSSDYGGMVTENTGQVAPLWFQLTDEHPTPRQRFHLDVWVPHDQAQTRIDRAVKAGGTVIDTDHAPSFTVLEDRQGNRACICVSVGR